MSRDYPDRDLWLRLRSERVRLAILAAAVYCIDRHGRRSPRVLHLAHPGPRSERRRGFGRGSNTAPSGYSKLERAVMKARGIWHGRGHLRRRKSKDLGSYAQFDRLVSAVGRRSADVIWRRGAADVAACISNPWKYQNDRASRPS